MNVDIPRSNTKIFIKSIQTLMKTGDEIHFNLYRTFLSICTLNAAKTVNVRFDFEAQFFTCFYSNESLEKSAVTSESISSPKISKANDKRCFFKCKLSSKSFHSLFKSNSNSIDKEVENFRIIFAPKEKDRIVFRFTYYTGVVKTHWIRILEQDSNPIKPKANAIHDNVMKPKHLSSTLCEILSNFQSNENELNIDVTDPKGENVVFRNYVENEALLTKIVRSQVILFGPSEFDVFTIKRKTAITVLLKPFKAAIQFADMFRLPVSIQFNGPKSPLLILMGNPPIYVEFTIALLLSEDEENTLTENVDEPQSANPIPNEENVSNCNNNNNNDNNNSNQKSGNIEPESKQLTIEPHVSLVETEVQRLAATVVELETNQHEIDQEEPVCEEFASDLVEQLDEPIAAAEQEQEQRATLEFTSQTNQHSESQSENYRHTKIVFEHFFNKDALNLSKSDLELDNCQNISTNDEEVLVESSQRSDCN